MKAKKYIKYVLILVLVVGLGVLIYCFKDNFKKTNYDKLTQVASHYQFIRTCNVDDCMGYIGYDDPKKLVTYNNEGIKLNEIDNSKGEIDPSSVIAVGKGFLVINVSGKFYVYSVKNNNFYVIEKYISSTDNYFIGALKSTDNYVAYDGEFNSLYNFIYPNVDIYLLNGKKYFLGYVPPLDRKASNFIDQEGKIIFGYGAQEKDLVKKELVARLSSNIVVINDRYDQLTLKDKEGKKFYQGKRYLYDFKNKKIISTYFNDFVFNYSNKTRDEVLVINSKKDSIDDINCKIYNIRTKKMAKCTENEEMGIKVYYPDLMNEMKDILKKYTFMARSYQFKGQKTVVAHDEVNNSCGFFDLKKRQITTVINNGQCQDLRYRYAINKINNHYLVIVPSHDNQQSFIYDFMANKKIYELKNSKYDILEYQTYQNGYKSVVAINRSNNKLISYIYDKNDKLIKEVEGKSYKLYNTPVDISYALTYYSKEKEINHNVFMDAKSKKEIEVDKLNYFYIDREEYTLINKDQKSYLVNDRTGKIDKVIDGELLLVSNGGAAFYNKNSNKSYFLSSKTGVVSSYKLNKDATIFNDNRSFIGMTRGNILINNKKNSSATIYNNNHNKIKEYKNSRISNIWEEDNYTMVEIKDIKTNKLNLIKLELMEDK